MPDTTARIRAKGLDATGITEDLAARMYGNLGGHYLAIVDLKVTAHGEDDDGKRTVALVDHVRDIQAALHRNRMLAENGPQLPIDGAPQAPTTEQVLQAGAAFDLDADDWEYDQPEGGDNPQITTTALEEATT